MRTFSWHRDGDARYVSSDERFTVEGMAGTSAGFRADEQFVAVGWVLTDSATGTETFHRKLRDAKHRAEEAANA